MKRLFFTLVALMLTASASQAGPLQRLFGRHQCQPCQPVQVQTTPTYTPAPVYHPVQQAVGTVLVQTGGVIQATGQAVQAYPMPTLVPGRPAVCSGGVCR